MLQLVSPNVELYDAFCEMTDEWTDIAETGHGMSMHVRPFEAADEFAEWVEQLLSEELIAPPNWVTCSFFWIVEDGTVLGGVSLRHELTERGLNFAGHIGYSVRPSARGRGIATWATRQVIPRAAERGIDRVLIVCDDDNPASARVIEKCGGVLEDIRAGEAGREPTSGRIRRYWVPTA